MSTRRFQHQAGLIVGLDVGGTKTEALLTNGDGRVLAAVRLPTPTGGGERVARGILSGIQHLLHKAGATLDAVQAVGIGIPGQVEGGTVRRAVNLGIEAFPLAQYLQEHIHGVPVVVENDVYTAALGAHDVLNRQMPLNHMVYLGIGTGIAAGVIIDGKLYKGAHGMAGEIGHVVVEPDGEVCNCGARGCLETVASGPAFTRQAVQALRTGQATRLRNIQPLDAQAVFQAAREGDVVARQIIDRSTFYLAQAIQWLLLCYDVEKVVLGGGIAREGPALVQPILRHLRAWHGQSKLADLLLDESRLIARTTTPRVDVWGAVVLAQRYLQSERGG